MNIIYADYNIYHNSIDICTYAGYILRIDCAKAEEELKTTPNSECVLNALAIEQHETIWFGIIELSKKQPQPEVHAMLKSITQVNQNDKQIPKTVKSRGASQSLCKPPN